MTDTSGPSRHIPVGLSSSSVYPGGIEATFEAARDLGYDGVEVMVLADPLSRDGDALCALSDHYELPILAIHAPTLLLTQNVWGSDPWDKVDRAAELAHHVGADTVVIHPPFIWQRRYAENFVGAITERERLDGMRLAVENMFPWRAKTGRLRERSIQAYAPGWDPLEHEYGSVTLDLSHSATAGYSPEETLDMVDQLGDRLAHLHLCDGSPNFKDEHWPPGVGNQPCDEVLRRLAERSFGGSVVVELNTRGKSSVARRTALADSLAFAREHLGQPVGES